MVRILCALWLFFFGSALYAQDPIKWGELTPIRGAATGIIPRDGSNFFTTRWTGGLFGTMFLGKHEHFVLTKTGKIQTVVGKNIVTFEAVGSISGQIIVFLSDKQAGKHTLYMQRYDSLCQPSGVAEVMAEYELPRNWRKSGSFNITYSQNGSFMCVEYDVPNLKDDKQEFGYTVFTDQLAVFSTGNYEPPYELNAFEVSNRYLSNTGDYFIACKVFNVSENGRVKDNSTLEKAVVLHVTASGLNSFDVDLDGKRIFDLGFSSDNNRLMTFTGLYGDPDKASFGIKGIFYFRLDFDKKQIIDSGFEPFSVDFITEHWTEKERQKAQRNDNQGKFAPQLYNYDIRQTVTLADGSIVGLLEQYYIQQVSSPEPRSNAGSFTFYYYYNNLIAYKIQPNGTFEWVKTIPKFQASANDYGYYSSVAHYITDDKMVLFFNDNLKNYDAKGNWNQSVFQTSYSKRTNTVARVEVDLKSGEVERKTFFERSDTKGLAVPKLFQTDYKNRQLILLLIFGKKEKYGILNF